MFSITSIRRAVFSSGRRNFGFVLIGNVCMWLFLARQRIHQTRDFENFSFSVVSSRFQDGLGLLHCMCAHICLRVCSLGLVPEMGEQDLKQRHANFLVQNRGSGKNDFWPKKILRRRLAYVAHMSDNQVIRTEFILYSTGLQQLATRIPPTRLT